MGRAATEVQLCLSKLRRSRHDGLGPGKLHAALLLPDERDGNGRRRAHLALLRGEQAEPVARKTFKQNVPQHDA